MQMYTQFHEIWLQVPTPFPIPVLEISRVIVRSLLKRIRASEDTSSFSLQHEKTQKDWWQLSSYKISVNRKCRGKCCIIHLLNSFITLGTYILKTNVPAYDKLTLQKKSKLWDDSVDVGTCCHPWWPDFNLHIPYGGGRKLNHTKCPPSYTWILWHTLITHTLIHAWMHVPFLNAKSQ